MTVAPAQDVSFYIPFVNRTCVKQITLFFLINAFTRELIMDENSHLMQIKKYAITESFNVHSCAIKIYYLKNKINY